MVSDRKLRARAQPATTESIRRARPSRILNTGKKALLSNAIAQGNSTQSNLLSLPAELRNRIYGLVLGGQTLHIYSHTHYDHGSKRRIRNSGHHICCAKVQDDEFAQIVRHADEVFEIHREAALMPFQYNTFAMDDSVYQEPFFERFVPAQIRAITSLSWYSRYGIFLSKLKPRFAGLTKLVAIMRLQPYYERTFRERIDDAKRLREAIGFSSSRDYLVASATVCFLRGRGDWNELKQQADPAYSDLSGKVEKAMMT
ncbi:hypothetical protein LTR36_006225 [Oleoguttula mirabilis]|uniref:DUF7730 domain-containing protein n=1 Tax=Oleoguttula mirabilis TaxID=1507867 RepID=A0AAV9JC38_9PEZI|nr:hypothetical protein LTR36_006225 [Oleoguttula mirabilis]